jgi:hypothetical protein
MLANTVGNILINGDFSRSLWTRLDSPVAGVECPVWRQTFAADRWKVRYGQATGAVVCQAQSPDIPPNTASACSLELRGADGVSQPVLIGQRIEAAEAARYRRHLVFSAWIRVVGSSAADATFALVLGSAKEPNVFGGASNDGVKSEMREAITLPSGRWVHLEHAIDGRTFGANGLSLEFEIPASLLAQRGQFVRFASMRLDDLAAGAGIERPAAMETLLARRFFQRYDSGRINSLGRALVVNAHELHFQFTFAEMRGFPTCTLPHDDAGLRVFNLEGIPQAGFRYDITYRSRGSAIIRATRENHGLADGFLSFVGSEGAILLDAEL